MYCFLVGFRLGHFCVYGCDLDQWFWSSFFKRIRNFISVVGLGLGLLWCKLGNSLLIRWVYLGRHKGHVAYYMFSHLQFNALVTFVFDCLYSFLTYKGKLWIETIDSNLILHSWPAFSLLITKGLFSLPRFIDFKLWDYYVLVFFSFCCCPFLKMDFKVVLTHSSRAPIKSCAPIPNPTLDLGLEDLPIMDEKDLDCCESFAKLYLIGKFLGESVLLKSISSKMKAEWKILGKSCFMDLVNDLFLIKFSTFEDCTKVWREKPFFTQNQVVVLQRWRKEFDPFSETRKATTF